MTTHENVLTDEFEAWWKESGQFCRAGGGDYEKTFAFKAWEASRAKQAAQVEQPMPEFYAQLEYNTPDWDVLVSVYQRRADDTPLLVHQEKLKGQQAAQVGALVEAAAESYAESRYQDGKYGLVESAATAMCRDNFRAAIEAEKKGQV